MTHQYQGSCFCGACRWAADQDPHRNLVCHCTDCQRATSAPFAAFVGFAKTAVTWDGPITHFETSTGSWRGFCQTCGTRLYFHSERWPEEMHVYATTLPDHASYTPTAEVCTETRLAYVPPLPGIAQHGSFAKSAAKPRGADKS